MSQGYLPDDDTLDPRSIERIDSVCDAFENEWRYNLRPQIVPLLRGIPEPERSTLLGELIRLELHYRRQHGERPKPEEYLVQFPDLTHVVNAAFESAERVIDSTESGGRGETLSYALPQRVSDTITDFACPSNRRFSIQRILGGGTFGKVHLAHDDDLRRQVAIKVPHGKQLQSQEEVNQFLDEARKAVGLEHPGIVQVYEAGRQSNGRPYVVMQYVDGNSLNETLQCGPLPYLEVVPLLIQVADAVGYAHRHGFVHRDLKPANLLLDTTGKPFVADFGLAVHESEQWHRAGEQAGTPAYMAPEQIRGETERLDGRADIWALGVILYEMLSGQRPFRAEKFDQLCEEILKHDPKPLRQINDEIPESLWRICQKCLCKKPTDRYQSAADLIKELRQFLRPRQRRVAWAGLAAVIAVLLPVMAGFYLADREPRSVPKDVSSDKNSKSKADHPNKFVSAEPVKLSGDIDVLIWDQNNENRRGIGLRAAGALPLHEGDEIRIEAQLSRPAYIYILWIDTAGVAFPVYPWQPGDWASRPESETLTDRVSLPEQADLGWPVTGGPGMESLVLLARDAPLPRDVDLQKELSDLPQQSMQNSRSLVEFEKGAVITNVSRQQRGPQFFDPHQIDDPVLKTHRLLQKKIGQRFQYTRAVSFANQGE